MNEAGFAPGSTFSQEHSYLYDGANRLTSFDTFAGTAFEGRDYQHDAADQLTQLSGGGVNSGGGSFAYLYPYAYDDNGNRIAMQGVPTIVTDPANRLKNDGTHTYQYDNEGNVTRKTDDSTGDYTKYAWDHRNRLITVLEYDSNGTPSTADDVLIQQVWNYYDAQNQLVRRYDDTLGAAIEQTIFAHDDGQVALQFDKTGARALASGHLSHRYLWGAAVDQLFADEQVNWLDGDADGEVLWALTDHLGSVRDVVDNNGTRRLNREFDSFGNVTTEKHYNGSGSLVSAGQTGFVAEAFGFTGRWFDKDTGLQNNLNRWYDARIGRWLSEDPISFAAGDANLYRYVGNLPTMHTDPSGLVRDVGWDWPSWHDYWYYLTNPGEQDDDIQKGQKFAVASSAVCLIGAGGLGIAGFQSGAGSIGVVGGPAGSGHFVIRTGGGWFHGIGAPGSVFLTQYNGPIPGYFSTLAGFPRGGTGPIPGGTYSNCFTAAVGGLIGK